MRLDIQMPLHLNKMMEGSVKILETINFQMGYLSELEYGIFSERLKAMNITLSHLNNTLIEGIYHPIVNRSRRALLGIGIISYIYVPVMMMIVPNSRARKGGKESGEVKGSMEEFEGRKRGMPTTGEWCNPVSNMLYLV